MSIAIVKRRLIATGLKRHIAEDPSLGLLIKKKDHCGLKIKITGSLINGRKFFLQTNRSLSCLGQVLSSCDR